MTIFQDGNQGGAADRMTSNLVPENPQQPRELEMSSPPKSVLIVDDNSINRKLLRTILQAENYTTFEAEDGIEGLQP